ncbi:MAG TPA: hypothetical protein VF166_03265 [Gemmatimonadaceae bacterium]
MSLDAAPGAPASAVLSRDLADFLIELSIALHKRAMYPGDHPSLAADQDRVMRRLTALLLERNTLSVGVARDQLIIEGIATDARNSLLRNLAQHLHRHHIGAAKFLAGMRGDEMADVLRTLSVDADRDGPIFGPNGIGVTRNWEHVRLFPVTYDQLELIDETQADAPQADRQPWSAQLWLDLARAALQADTTDERPPTDPVVVAQAINSHAREQAYDQVIVGYLLKISGELKAADREDAAILRRRVSGLIRALDPEQLRHLLAMGGDAAQRRRFVLDASHGMAVDSVLTLVQAAADVSKCTISTPLLRMFSKLAAHAERGSEQARPEAEAALREHVQELVADWHLADPNPARYSAVLERATRDTPLFVVADESTHACEPDRVVQMALEVGSVGPAVYDAANQMVERSGLTALFEVLERAPGDGRVTDALRTHVATPDHLRRVLATPPLDFDRVALIVHHMGMAAAEPLLDALAVADTRALRRKLLDLLSMLGSEVAPLLVSRLPDAPWYVQRNLLLLLDRLPALPDGFSLEPYATHADARVRREALRLRLKRAGERDAAIIAAFADDDEQIVRIALMAAHEACPAAGIPVLARRLARHDVETDLEVLAIKVIAAANAPGALECLLDYAIPAKGWFRRRRLAAKSPQLLAALAGIAAHWAWDPRTTPILTRAAHSPDDDVRAAVAAWRGAR